MRGNVFGVHGGTLSIAAERSDVIYVRTLGAAATWKARQRDEVGSGARAFITQTKIISI